MSKQAVQDKTAIETWTGKKPWAKHLRLFGFVCYIHVLDQKRHKLEEKVVKGIFLGYNRQSKGYKVYNLQTKKLTINRDIEVNGSDTWN